LATELAAEAVQQAIIEVLQIRKRDSLTFYRYYHVFRKGELEELIGQIDSLRVIDSYYDHANWCVVAEKL
jgi:hypothetical protein